MFVNFMMLVVLVFHHFGFVYSSNFLFLQPCPAKVAVPCPPAFAPGKFCLVILIFIVSVYTKFGNAD